MLMLVWPLISSRVRRSQCYQCQLSPAPRLVASGNPGIDLGSTLVVILRLLLTSSRVMAMDTSVSTQQRPSLAALATLDLTLVVSLGLGVPPAG